MKIKSWKLQELSKEIENGLDYEGLINLRKKVYNVKVELYSDEWYEKRILLTCIKEFLDECEPIKKESKPTEEEIKKEWEKLGWKYEKDSLSITLTKSSRVITIYLHNKEYDCTRHNMWKVGTLTFQEHQLLTKTFKWLKWE